MTGEPGSDLSGLFSILDLASRKTVVAAVSGGSDSTALLLLLKDYLDGVTDGPRPVAVTVNHGLRPGSAEEAAGVARLCAERGIAHRTVVWAGQKPIAGLPAAAREARHELLAEAASAEGTDLVLTGHTADDQAETVLMRQARDEGRGLAGIAPATLFGGQAWFARPLLGCRREALRDVLRRHGVNWAEDPTNADERYERPRVRKLLGATGSDADFQEALAVGGQAAKERETLGKQAAAIVRDHAARPAPGLIRLGPRFLEDEAAGVYALRILLATVGGMPHLPEEAASVELVRRLAAGEVFRAVLSRTLVDARKAGIFLLREARNLPEPMPVLEDMIWDGRYRIAGAVEGMLVATGAGSLSPPELVEGWGGVRGGGNEPRQTDVGVPESLLRAASAAEPVLLDSALLHTPTPDPSPPFDKLRRGGELALIPLVAPWARYLPSFDLAPARAVVELLAAPEIPPLPFRQHNERKA